MFICLGQVVLVRNAPRALQKTMNRQIRRPLIEVLMYSIVLFGPLYAVVGYRPNGEARHRAGRIDWRDQSAVALRPFALG